MVTWGTLSTLDLLASNPNLQTVAQVGEDRVWQSVQALFAIHNQMVSEQAATLMDDVDYQMSSFGGGDAMTMDVIDQYGTPGVQKIAAGYNIGFPLRKYGRGIGWTRDYFERATMTEFNRQVQGIFDADLTRLGIEIRRALYTPTNSTFKDTLTNNLDLPVKALVNADGLAMPPDPYGNTFNAATHTHYLGAATLNTTAMDALIGAVLEHYATGRIVVYANQAQVGTIRGLTGFNAYLDERIIPSTTLQRAAGSLDQANFQNRAIGIYDNSNGAAEVWVKPWTLAGYLVAFNVDQAKPLVMRRPMVGGMGNLRLVADWEQYPLRATAYDREYGISVRERINGAVLEIVGGGVYAVPTSF